MRLKHKLNIVPFLSRLEHDCQKNLQALIEKAQLLEIEGFENIAWEESTWIITGGRLTKLPAKNVGKTSLNFHYASNLGGKPLPFDWANLIKALVILRFKRKNQGVSNHRKFITAASYVVHDMVARNLNVFQLTPENLNRACTLIPKHYSESATYNLHRALEELAAHCDANKLCSVFLNYKYSQIKRPKAINEIKCQRLDNTQVLETTGKKLVDSEIYKILGELYKNVPSNHKYRIYVLLLTLLALLGRRFSEISLLPNQHVRRDNEGRAYLEYFPCKISQGDIFTPLRRLFLPTEVIDVVESVIDELGTSCSTARDTATEMQRVKGADLRPFLHLSDTQSIYKKDLEQLGIGPSILCNAAGWLRKNGYAFFNENELAANSKNSYYTDKVSLLVYCKHFFKPEFIKPMHVDQYGKKYYLKDLLLVKHLGMPSPRGGIFPWVATQVTHNMMAKFFQHFVDLAKEYASSLPEVDFTSHCFRHTLNTLLDEGGLTDLLQTRWFGRANPRDTKAYQHTSPEKRALMLREDIKAGQVGGLLAEQIQVLPVNLQDAVLNARVKAVHDVGTGICIHNFSQTPCERHLQCSAECKDYLWAKGDEGRKEELKRQYAMTVVARNTAESIAQSNKPRKSVDWLLHNEKKLRTLTTQLADNGIDLFDPYEYLEQHSNG